MKNHVDVLVIGAGISGVSAGYHLQKHCPQKSFAMLERRAAMGGTWDLFRYPGIRSDSDMYTLGFAFKPWQEQKAIADGPSILKYINATADQYGLREKIRFRRRVKTAHWSSDAARWTVEAECADTGETEQWSCNFLSFCSGYYNYDAGYTPEFKGRDAFEGTIVHPQHWPQDLDYAGKKVIIIGSGATAVTLAPEIAKHAAHVTMLQRSPTYMVSRPSEDGLANFLRKILPSKLAYGLTRWRNVLMQLFFFKLARRRPRRMKEKLLGWVTDALPAGYDVKKHFTPNYNPWDQRLCLVPDGDFFEAIADGSTSIATDEIVQFTANGIKLKSGDELQADIIITATGLDLQSFGGAALYVDGKQINPGSVMTYRGMMYSGAPNLSVTFGYTNASWTLKADLTSQYMCRLLNHMDKIAAVECTPVLNDPKVQQEPFVDFSSGYFKRVAHRLPKQGSKKPWRLNQNYAADIVALRYGAIEDGVLQFRQAGEAASVGDARGAMPAAAE